MGKTVIHLLNCKKVTTRLAIGDRKSMPWREQWVIGFHLAICWVCRKYERQMKAIGSALGRSMAERLRQEDLPGFHQRLIDRLRKS